MTTPPRALPQDRLAVVSDIHGNRDALEAVLADITEKQITHVVNLGDCVYGPLDPAGTADLLIDLGWPTVRGNEDRIIVSQVEGSLTLQSVRRSLRRTHLDWLEGLPPAAFPFEGVYMCHGAPACDDTYLLHAVTSDGAVPREPSDVARLMDGVCEPLVLCGHDHVPGGLIPPGGGRIVNPGSVGLQAYTDDSPYPHRMETGSPHARYTVLTRDGAGWQEDRIAVPYDWQRAAETARRNGRADWAAWLSSGIASSTGGPQ
jgi:predicted phosphodiesterase